MDPVGYGRGSDLIGACCEGTDSNGVAVGVQQAENNQELWLLPGTSSWKVALRRLLVLDACPACGWVCSIMDSWICGKIVDLC